MAIRTRNEHQRNVLKKMDSLSGRYTRYQIYSDFVILSALYISNSVDLLNQPERMKQARQIEEKYTKAELKVLAEMFGEMVAGLEKNADQDFLGELFMMCEFGSDAHGQFFTPYSVCSVMARLNSAEDIDRKIKKQGYVSVSDCACGAGATLIAFANYCLSRDINYQLHVLFIAQDIDYLTACQCYIQMSLLGMPGYVAVGDSLTDPSTSWDDRGLLPTKPKRCFFTPMFFSAAWTGRKIIARMALEEKRFKNSLDSMSASIPSEPEEKKEIKPEPEKARVPEITSELKEVKGGQLSLF